MMLDLVGTAATSAVTLAVAAIVRAPGIPAAVRRRDAQVAGRDRSLETWTADRDYELRRECAALREAVPSGGNPDAAGDYPFARTMEAMAEAQHKDAAARADREIADAKARALHQWRDQAALIQGELDDILSAEGWAHRAYRLAFRKPAPMLRSVDRVAPILDAWRKPSAMSNGAMTWPDDATQRTLDEAIATMPVTGP